MKPQNDGISGRAPTGEAGQKASFLKRVVRSRKALAAAIAAVAEVAVVGSTWLVFTPASPSAQRVASVNDEGSSFPADFDFNKERRHVAAAASPTSAPTQAPQAPQAPARSGPGRVGAAPRSGLPHVLVIIEENKGYGATLGSCGADPYLCSLASTYASDSAWFGVSHPSEPNYVALASGGIQGCVSDSSCRANSLSQPDLGGQLTAARIPWVGYMESMPSACYTGGSAGGYALKHNPFGFFTDNYVGACHIQPYPGASGLVSALNGPSAPAFVWITPNSTNDMHDGSVQQGDAWLKANLAPVLASPWFTGGNATVVVTMDENDAAASGSCCGAAAGGQVPMVVISNRAAGKHSFASTGDHYGTLRTIEEVYGLQTLGLARSTASGDLSALFGG
jgi:phosphatidylinositol-3-phosphatase